MTELKHVNDDLMSHKNETSIAMKVSESFKKEYAMVLLQLKEASDQVCARLTDTYLTAFFPLKGVLIYPFRFLLLFLI